MPYGSVGAGGRGGGMAGEAERDAPGAVEPCRAPGRRHHGQCRSAGRRWGSSSSPAPLPPPWPSLMERVEGCSVLMAEDGLHAVFRCQLLAGRE